MFRSRWISTTASRSMAASAPAHREADMSDWSTFTINSWNVGFQADVYQQNGGSIPTITLQSTLSQSVPDALAGHDVPQYGPRIRLRPERGRDARAARRRSAHRGRVETPLVDGQSEHRRLCRRLLSVGQQLEVHRPLRRSVVRRRAASEPDAVPALYPADRKARSRPDGRQRQPPVRRDRRRSPGCRSRPTS